MRCFISVELPDEIKQKMQKAIDELKTAQAEVKWVEAKNIHLTLKFLGWVEEKNLEKLVSIVENEMQKFTSFKVNFEGVGTFPAVPAGSPREAGRQEGRAPRVVWVGTTSGENEMKEITKALEKSLSQEGFRSEEREFKGHATVGRVKGKKVPRQARDEGVDKLKEKIVRFKDLKFGECSIDHIHIMKSTLTKKGPVYEVYKKVRLH